MEHTARMGVPSERNSVYFALTFSRYPANENLPQPKRTPLGSGLFLSLEFCVGMQASVSRFTFLGTSRPGSPEASSNIAPVSDAGSGPRYSEGGAFLAAVMASKFHLAALSTWSSFGLKSNSIGSAVPPADPCPVVATLSSLKYKEALTSPVAAKGSGPHELEAVMSDLQRLHGNLRRLGR